MIVYIFISKILICGPFDIIFIVNRYGITLKSSHSKLIYVAPIGRNEAELIHLRHDIFHNKLAQAFFKMFRKIVYI